MINYDSFAKFNTLDSTSLDDVRRLTSNELMFYDIRPDEVRTLDYCGSEEVKHAGDWKHEDFNYDINYYGFRMKEIPKSVDIGVFGCSFTFGYGMPVTGMWHTLLGKALNQSVANFGVNGLSATSIIDVFLIVSKHIKIKKAVFLLPQFERYQIAKTDISTNDINYLNIIPNHNSKLCECYGVYSDQVYKAVPEEQMFRDVRNSLYIAEHIAKYRNIEMYVSTWSKKSYQFMEQMNFNHAKLLPEWYHPVEIGPDVARDGRHPGFKLNQFFANLITPHI